MLCPTLSNKSFTVIVKCPTPDPISGVTLNVPAQFVPAPVKVIGTLAPSGGSKFSSGVVPVFGSSVSCKLTETRVLFVAWTGAIGEVVIAPAGGRKSMTNAAPDGEPLNGFPIVSTAETLNVTGPEGNVGPTLISPSKVLIALFVSGRSVGELPFSLMVAEGSPLIGSDDVTVTRRGPRPAGEGLLKPIVKVGG